MLRWWPFNNDAISFDQGLQSVPFQIMLRKLTTVLHKSYSLLSWNMVRFTVVWSLYDKHISSRSSIIFQTKPSGTFYKLCQNQDVLCAPMRCGASHNQLALRWPYIRREKIIHHSPSISLQPCSLKHTYRVEKTTFFILFNLNYRYRKVVLRWNTILLSIKKHV